jgi:hypothetical protein
LYVQAAVNGTSGLVQVENPDMEKGEGLQVSLSTKISELSLKINGSRLEPLIKQLFEEMEKAGISFRPKTYLSDEWGCPNKVPVIGIPFYLVDPQLCRLEGESTGIEAEDDREVMMYLRHEAGHAFNYAYTLYQNPEWRRIFGRFSQPYRDDYRPIPFDTRFVRHAGGWYAQKHPDDDFAETFAVWLTPNSEWRKWYANTPALTKLLYVDEVVRKYGKQPPVMTDEKLDMPVQEMTMTLDTWYRTCKDSAQIHISLPYVLGEDLRNMFPDEHGQPAADILLVYRKQLIQDVNQWTGISRRLSTALVDELLDEIKSLGLKIEAEQTSSQEMRMGIFVTTLAMNYLSRGQFVATENLSDRGRVK